MLRSVPDLWVHILAFGLLGYIAGLVVTFAPFLGGGAIAESGTLFALIIAVVCGLCTAAGRFVAYWLRQRRRETSVC